MKSLIIITVTSDRPDRLTMLRRIAAALAAQEALIWLVVEDGEQPDTEVTKLLDGSGVFNHYWAVGPTHDGGSTQRNDALQYIRDRGLEGVIYNAEANNFYYTRLFDELRKTDRISVIPVGNLGPFGVERPILEHGEFLRWDAGKLERKFPINLAGFGCDAKVLHELVPPLWGFVGVGGETEFLERVAAGPNEFQFLCNGCSECLIFHNEPLPEGWEEANLEFEAMIEPLKFRDALVAALYGSLGDQLFLYAFAWRVAQATGRHLLISYEGDCYSLDELGVTLTPRHSLPLKDCCLVYDEPWEAGVGEEMIAELEEETSDAVWLAGRFQDFRFLTEEEATMLRGLLQRVPSAHVEIQGAAGGVGVEMFVGSMRNLETRLALAAKGWGQRLADIVRECPEKKYVVFSDQSQRLRQIFEERYEAPSLGRGSVIFVPVGTEASMLAMLQNCEEIIYAEDSLGSWVGWLTGKTSVFALPRKSQVELSQNFLTFSVSDGGLNVLDFSQYESRGGNMLRMLRDLVAAAPASFEGKIGMASFGDTPPEPAADLAAQFDFAFCTTKWQGRPSAFQWIPSPNSIAWPQVGIDDGEALLQQMLDHAAPPETAKLFWIGADTHPVRGQLRDLAADHPDMMDIELMGWKPTGGIALASKTRFVSLFDHVQFKYLVDLPGYGYSGRLRWLLASGRPVFVVERTCVEPWFEELVPWVHFVPVKDDLSDLFMAYGRIEAAAKLYNTISNEARSFVRENLFWKQEKKRILGDLTG